MTETEIKRQKRKQIYILFLNLLCVGLIDYYLKNILFLLPILLSYITCSFFVLKKYFDVKTSISVLLMFVLLSNLLTFLIWRSEYNLKDGLLRSCIFFISVLMISKIIHNLVNKG